MLDINIFLHYISELIRINNTSITIIVFVLREWDVKLVVHVVLWIFKSCYGNVDYQKYYKFDK